MADSASQAFPREPSYTSGESSSSRAFTTICVRELPEGVTRREFRKALPLLGVHCPSQIANSLFTEWDTSGVGRISHLELLNRLGARELDSESRLINH